MLIVPFAVVLPLMRPLKTISPNAPVLRFAVPALYMSLDTPAAVLSLNSIEPLSVMRLRVPVLWLRIAPPCVVALLPLNIALLAEIVSNEVLSIAPPLLEELFLNSRISAEISRLLLVSIAPPSVQALLPTKEITLPFVP